MSNLKSSHSRTKHHFVCWIGCLQGGRQEGKIGTLVLGVAAMRFGQRQARGGKPRLLLRDNVLLEGDKVDAQEKVLRKKMHGLRIFGTLVLKGPLVDSLASFFLAEFLALPRIGARDFRSQEKMEKDSGIVLSKRESWRQLRLKGEKEEGLLWSAAKVRGCTVVKFGAPTVEGGRTWLGSLLREEGSIEQQFGEDSLMCVR